MPRLQVRVYVDGFNLYNRLLTGHPDLKWLDLPALAAHLLPDYDIQLVRYFTAILKPGLTIDAQSPVRQQMYLRALAADPRVEIHLGTFRNDKRHMVMHPATKDPQTGRFITVTVRKLEEKGSDVNLATHLIVDAQSGIADIYVVLSNDSDLAEPIRILKHTLGYSTGIIFPMPSARNSKELVKTTPDIIVDIDRVDLVACQYPEQLSDEVGNFRRPKAWTAPSDLGPSASLSSEGPKRVGPSNR